MCEGRSSWSVNDGLGALRVVNVTKVARFLVLKLRMFNWLTFFGVISSEYTTIECRT